MAGRRRHTEEIDPRARDFVIARIAIARTDARAAVEQLDEALALFSDPDEDPKGKDRNESLAEALELLGRATRAAESAEDKIGAVDPEAGEPWDDEEESHG